MDITQFIKRFSKNARWWAMVCHNCEIINASQIIFTFLNSPHNSHTFKLNCRIVSLRIRETTGGAVDEAKPVVLIPLDKSIPNAKEPGGISEKLSA